ncbi:AMP-binding protein [Wenzhouxiangella limi]|uniref:AMP-binding protein n=1 Tax=Wenzhouxiangella limi TaxID=2707351 RepID=A0A845UY20_9GAMM|nr:AMP-binding protein [Wenzhouxiangella limi]NDY96317.1 AMP-binding protein [Wenzhouxiangella limi]
MNASTHIFQTLANDRQLKGTAETDQAVPCLRRLDAGASVTRAISNTELASQVQRLASGMAARGWAGERVVVAAADETAFLCAFLACLQSGVVAVPAVSPGTARNNHRLAHYAADAGAVALLVDTDAQLQLRMRSDVLAGWSVETLEALTVEGSDRIGSDFEPSPDAPAYLQYTSGSTRAPKGVIISRANLSAHLAMLADRVPLDQSELVINPMPLYHDAGLLMSLNALHQGAGLMLLPALYAVRDPFSWLDALSRYRAALTPSATFLLDLCTRKIDQARLKALDLSALRALLIGAEPIPYGVVRDFTRRFAACGFSQSAMRPSYGMAETTLLISTTGTTGPVVRRYASESLRRGKVRPDEKGEAVVSSGRPCTEDSVRIVDPDSGQASPERTVGEVWVRAAYASEGYWHKPHQSKETMHNSLPGESGRWLRTGDLAFFDGGELFVLGRISDTLIIRGENRYPQDIEWAVAGCHPAIQTGGVVAFSIAHRGLEGVALACEIRRATRRSLNTGDVFRCIRRALVEQLGLAAARIVLVPEAALPRTSSGKLARRRCRANCEAERLKVLAEWTATDGPMPEPSSGDDLQHPPTLLTLCRRMLRAPTLGVDDDLFSHGLDSLRAAELALDIEGHWGVSLDLGAFEYGVSVEAIQDCIDGKANPAESATPARLPLDEFDAGRLRRMQSYTVGWRGDWISANRLVFGRNLAGQLPPLAWCFQGFAEFEAMAKHLGPDQPLYGMRSAHYVAAHDDREAITGLARLYLEELSQAPAGAPVHLGGNCQGSVVALAMAREQLAKGNTVAGLFLLENITSRLDPQPVPVPVAMFFGQHSQEFNPYHLFPDPSPGWAKLYPAGYSIDLVEADHGGYFRPPGVVPFMRMLQTRLAAVPKGERIKEARPPLLAGAFRAGLGLAQPLPAEIAAGRKLKVVLELVNQSPEAWFGEDDLIVANHWLSEDEAVLQWLDDHQPVAEKVAPGETVRLVLEVTAPAVPGPVILEIDLAESGVAWLAEHGYRALRHPILVI